MDIFQSSSYCFLMFLLYSDRAKFLKVSFLFKIFILLNCYKNCFLKGLYYGGTVCDVAIMMPNLISPSSFMKKTPTYLIPVTKRNDVILK